ncbi:MAG: hypothetical protein ACFFD4_17985 [Candidatus Odinarchaeota archaeon]
MMSNQDDPIKDYSLGSELFALLQEGIGEDYTVEISDIFGDRAVTHNFQLTSIQANSNNQPFNKIWIAKVNEISIEELFSLRSLQGNLNSYEVGVLVLDDADWGFCRYFIKEMPGWFPTSSQELSSHLTGRTLINALERFFEIKRPLLRSEELEFFLSNASEDEFIDHFIVPLFRKMGFENVFPRGHHDRRGERGSDSSLIQYKLPFGKKIFFCFQAKKGNAATHNITNDLEQTKQILLRTFTDPSDNLGKTADFAVLIYSGNFTSDAEQTIREYTGNLDPTRKIHVFKKDELLFLFRGYPIEREEQEFIREYVANNRE